MEPAPVEAVVGCELAHRFAPVEQHQLDPGSEVRGGCERSGELEQHGGAGGAVVGPRGGSGHLATVVVGSHQEFLVHRHRRASVGHESSHEVHEGAVSFRGDRIECLATESSPIGTSRNIRPTITEVPLEGRTTVVMYTDGLMHAGEQYGQSLDICTLLESHLEEQEPTAQQIADAILLQALRLDQNRPNDDMSVVVLRVLPRNTDQIRRMVVRLPFGPVIDE